MSIILKVLGALTLFFSFITATLSEYTGVISVEDGFVGFLIIFGAGIAQAMIFFGLAAILDGQAELKMRMLALDSQFEYRKRTEKEKKECKACGREYDVDYTSCPHCGAKE